MKRKTPFTALIALCGLCFFHSVAHAGSSRLGVGVNYWQTLDDLDVDDIDEDGFSYLVTYQYHPQLIGLELDLEYIPDRFVDDAVAPQAYAILGETLYIGAGLGWVAQDGSFEDEPFYAFKAGVDLDMFTSLHLDVSVNYRFNDGSDLEDSDTNIDTDTLFLGAAVRWEL